MGQQGGGPVADAVDEEDGRAVHRQLKKKIQRNEHRHLRQGNPKLILKGQKQQGNKIVDHCLNDIADETGALRVFVGHGSILLFDAQ